MTEKILNMSREELINAVAEANEYGEKLQDLARTKVEARDDLLCRADKLEEEIEDTLKTVYSLATAIAEMKKILRDKYDTFVM